MQELGTFIGPENRTQRRCDLLFARAGYKTHMIGKWHLGFCNKKFWPQSRGFDTFYGYLTGHEGYYDHSHDGGYDFRDGEQVAVEANGTYSTQLMAERAAAVIRDHDPAAPLFLYVAFQSVHGGAEQPLEIRASNEGSQRFQNHEEGPY